MKIFLFLGKLVTLLFWAVVLVNLIQPLAQPFNLLLYVAGAVLVFLHVVEMLVFRKRLSVGRWPLWQHVQVLLFGVLHVLGLPERKEESSALPVAEIAEPEQVQENVETGNAQTPGTDAVAEPVEPDTGRN